MVWLAPEGSPDGDVCPKSAMSWQRAAMPGLDEEGGGLQAVQQMSSLPDLLICNNLEQIPPLIRQHFIKQQSREEVR